MNLADPAPTGEGVVLAAERRERLRSALGSLSSEQASIVQLSFFEDRSHSEIAESSGHTAWDRKITRPSRSGPSARAAGRPRVTTLSRPDDETLLRHAAGRLDAGLSLVVETHLALSPETRGIFAQFEAIGGLLLEESAPAPVEPSALNAALAALDSAAKPSRQVSQETLRPPDLPADLTLPRPLLGRKMGAWRWIAPGVRSRRVEIAPSSVSRAFLLELAPGVLVPRHGHEGREMTCVLRGSFIDRNQRYPECSFSPGRRGRRARHLRRTPRLLASAWSPSKGARARLTGLDACIRGSATYEPVGPSPFRRDRVGLIALHGCRMGAATTHGPVRLDRRDMVLFGWRRRRDSGAGASRARRSKRPTALCRRSRADRVVAAWPSHRAPKRQRAGRSALRGVRAGMGRRFSAASLLVSPNSSGLRFRPRCDDFPRGA